MEQAEQQAERTFKKKPEENELGSKGHGAEFVTNEVVVEVDVQHVQVQEERTTKFATVGDAWSAKLEEKTLHPKQRTWPSRELKYPKWFTLSAPPRTYDPLERSVSEILNGEERKQ